VALRVYTVTAWLCLFRGGSSHFVFFAALTEPLTLVLLCDKDSVAVCLCLCTQCQCDNECVHRDSVTESVYAVTTWLCDCDSDCVQSHSAAV